MNNPGWGYMVLTRNGDSEEIEGGTLRGFHVRGKTAQPSISFPYLKT